MCDHLPPPELRLVGLPQKGDAADGVRKVVEMLYVSYMHVAMALVHVVHSFMLNAGRGSRQLNVRIPLARARIGTFGCMHRRRERGGGRGGAL
jgi:hypothetical protein